MNSLMVLNQKCTYYTDQATTIFFIQTKNGTKHFHMICILILNLENEKKATAKKQSFENVIYVTDRTY